ncbi:MAG: hypothetical protein GF383_13560 [Candidatus Lokiarchaeota archaeon]|nr:hypothetical protein [Candidatus Lokiarchaeota archaeon]MBD3342252.1 hypothetical protein [Candidatus Lokiarchaeota archaeon]
MIFSESISDLSDYNSKESKLERHDLYNFETKLDYKFKKTSSTKTSYLLEMFFFIPTPLQINKNSYTKKQFFLDLNNRIRFKTPQISIKGLLDENNDLSPLNIIEEHLNSIEYGDISEKVTTRIERETRLLACIVKATLRDQTSYIITNYSTIKNQYNLEKIIKNLLSTVKQFQEKMQQLRERFLTVRTPTKLRETLTYADEYMSLQIEDWFSQLFAKCGKVLNSKLQNRLIQIVEYEKKHRETLNSNVVVERNTNNERFSYHEGIHKKFVQGVLYLDQKKKDPKSPSLQILYSIAAGLAMFLSLFFSFLLLSNFGVNSVPFLIGAIVIYMLKDRIKDIIKNYSEKAVGLLFPDQRVDIIDEFYQEQMGIGKEIVNFLEWEKVPSEILKIRRSSNISSIEESGKPEVVLNYKQKIILLNQKIEETHTRKKDLSNIIRFNIKEFLRYADDPVDYKVDWNKETKNMDVLPISRVYHLNIVLRLTSFHKKEKVEEYFKKFRVILDQQGIKRVEKPKIQF